jgi:hypothetical protein
MRTTPLIRVSSLNQVTSAALLWRHGGALAATVIVKATFRFVNNGEAVLVDPLPIVTADQEPSLGRVAAADEAVPRIPNAGVVFAGHACAPHGQEATSLAVRVCIAREQVLFEKVLHVYGALDPRAPNATSRPFATMPLDYGRALGGPGAPENPVGTGIEPGSAPPNVFLAADPTRPGGIAPIGRDWPARRRLRGALPLASLDAEMPEIPAAFDFRYFNPAPADQQLDVLRGDEWILLGGMHPSMPQVMTRLPRARAHAEWTLAAEKGPRDDGGVIELRADLLIVDGDAMVCSLVWRGSLPVAERKLDALRVFAGVELPGAPLPIGRGQLGGTSVAATTGLDPEVRAAMPDLPYLEKKAAPAVASLVATRQGMPAVMVAPPEVAATQVLPAAPKMPAVVRAPAAVAMTQDLPAAPKMPAVVRAPAAVAGTLDVDPQKAARPALPFQAPDPARPSPASMPGMPAVLRAPDAVSETGGLDVHLLLKDTMPFAKAPPAEPDGRETEPPPMLGLVAAEAAVDVAQPVAEEPKAAAEATRADGGDDEGEEEEERIDVRAEVIARLAAGGSLLGLDLVGADLHDLDFRGRLLSALDLHRANLRGANLAHVRMTGVNLAGANLTDAILSGANLSYAALGRADLTRAKLDGAVLVDAILTGAHGADVDCSGADLRRAKLSRARLPGARFAGADLRGAVLVGAELDEDALRGARRGKRKLHGTKPAEER